MARDTHPTLPRRWRPDLLIQNAIALMVSSGGSAVLGVVFWALAAHLAPAATVGETTAAIAAMVLLATLGQLSFGPIFERFLPVAGELTHSFVRRSYVLCVATSVVLVTGYLALGFGRNFLGSSPGGMGFFAVAVVLWAIFALQDSVLIGLRSSKWVAVENVGYGLVKLVLLPVFVGLSKTTGILTAWVIPVTLAILGVNWYLFRVRIPAHMATNRRSAELPTTRELFSLSTAQYASLLSTVFLPAIVTLVVIERLGAVANAYYYLPSLITTSLGMVAWSIVRSFIVEASAEPASLRRHADQALRGLAVVLIPSIVLGVILAPYYLRVFGTRYAEHGTTLIRMLLVAMLGSAVMVYYSAFAWIDKRVWWLTLRNVVFSAIYLVVVFTLIKRLGIDAIGVASLVYAALSVAVFLPITVRRYRRIP